MRRPQQDTHHHHHNHHNNHHHHHHHHGSSASPTRSRQAHDKDESRLAKVKRVLAVSLLGRSGGSNRVFGVRLELIDPYQDTGVPFVVHRLCSYIELNGFQSSSVFRLSGGSPRVAERLRAAFERRGDADLEGAGCPPTAATLLRQYLKELPQPVVPSTLVGSLLNTHAQEYVKNYESWIKSTKDLLSTLLPSHYRLLGYLTVYLGRYEAKHGRGAGVCGVFAPVIFPHVPPATILLRDILAAASVLFPDCTRDTTVNGVIPNDCRACKGSKDNLKESETSTLLSALKPRKRKERRESCCQERKLVRSNSEEQILEPIRKSADSIRRVSSHEDFNSANHPTATAKVGQEMGHGVRCASLPLHERTNISPVFHKPSPLPSPCDVVLAAERFECDAERLRRTERFSRSVTPRGRRQARRRRVHIEKDGDQGSSKENEEESENMYAASNHANNRNGAGGQSFLEMLSSGPSRSPSPARPPTVEHDDGINPSLTNWGFPHRQAADDEASARVEAMLSPRNSLVVPRRFYSETEVQPSVPITTERGLKTLTKHINGLKKKIKMYEEEFEENFGYRPSHSDKMSNRDIKRLCSELNKLRKEHKLLKEDPIGALLANVNNKSTSPGNRINNNNSEKSRTTLMEEMVIEVERKLSDKRLKYDRSDDMDDLTHEQLMDEKTAVQKALLHIEGTFGRPVSKEDRAVVRPLYDRYRTLKRLLIRAGPHKNKDSVSELATILEHEAMDFTSSSLPSNAADGERRASEPDMSHRGILDCIENVDQLPTDSDSQHSSSEGSRGGAESLHALPQEELEAQQRATREEKKRLRRALKELEAQFEARAGRRMQREDRGPPVTTVYESYKQAKAKLRLIDALIAKKA
ncbi:protein FAM13B [Athalia rosae]|uniref:protein FAM13B n=1 Tax=Athalia rosae TaxID=37344 RepID=UPI002033F312|nr:protein FAM13B [Athalia rosae]XP_012262119.2 protein FAM13B [Athalia rosae]XP_048509641.1 protein FAM13B [Athalia rosae]